jgi:GT2 family glycosyltransferase
MDRRFERRDETCFLGAGVSTSSVKTASNAPFSGPFPLRIALGIATAGRPLILAETLREIAGQTHLPDKVFVCPAADSDFDAAGAASLPYPLRVVKSRRGLTAQRNAILDAAHGFDIVVFFDDDFFAAPTYLAELERCFAADPTVVAISGHVIADGVKGPGLEVNVARAVLASFVPAPGAAPPVDQHNAYGCNMSARLDPICKHRLRFDENLPLYGWLEDVDFCRQLASHGRIVKNARMIGVHLGFKGGRTSGVRFGYSQVANPLYMWRKGSTGLPWTLRQMSRNLLANIGYLPRPEPWVDRRGRVRGNLLAFHDLIRGRLDPRRILEFK